MRCFQLFSDAKAEQIWNPSLLNPQTRLCKMTAYTNKTAKQYNPFYDDNLCVTAAFKNSVYKLKHFVCEFSLSDSGSASLLQLKIFWTLHIQALPSVQPANYVPLRCVYLSSSLRFLKSCLTPHFLQNKVQTPLYDIQRLSQSGASLLYTTCLLLPTFNTPTLHSHRTASFI